MGLLGGEAEIFLKRLANHLFDVWDRNVVRWICLRLAFALLCAVAVCLCGSRTKYDVPLVWRTVYSNQNV